MSLRERLQKAADGFRLRKQEEEITPHAQTGPTTMPDTARKAPTQPTYITGWLGRPRYSYVAGEIIDPFDLRRLALTPTPHMCIQRKMQDVMTTQWEIVPLAQEDKEQADDAAKQHARAIQQWLWQGPNDNHEPFSNLLGKFAYDLEALDAGVWAKEYGSRGSHQLVQLWSMDGGLIWKEIDLKQRLGVVKDVHFDDEVISNYNVGYWYNPYGLPASPLSVPWEPHELIYASQFPRSDIPYGTSKVHVLKTIISALIHGEEFYYEYWVNGAVGNSIIGAEATMTDAQWQQWKTHLTEQIESHFAKPIYLDSNPKTQTYGYTPEELKWLEACKDYRQLVMAIFGVTGEVLGYTQDIHKATAESQRSVYIDRCLWPMLKLIEWYVNTQIITEFFWKEQPEKDEFRHGHEGPYAGKPIDAMFRFKLYDPLGEAKQLDVDEKRMKQGLTTVNEIRLRQGKKPLSWGDLNPQFLLNPQQWAQSWFYQAFDPESWTECTGLPAPPKVMEAVKPATTPQESEEAYKRSRTDSAYEIKRVEKAETKRMVTDEKSFQKTKKA